MSRRGRDRDRKPPTTAKEAWVHFQEQASPTPALGRDDAPSDHALVTAHPKDDLLSLLDELGV